MVFHFIHRLNCLIKKKEKKKHNSVSRTGGEQLSPKFPTFSQASEMVLWNRTDDLMTSNINVMLSWLLTADCAGSDLFAKLWYRSVYVILRH